MAHTSYHGFLFVTRLSPHGHCAENERSYDRSFQLNRSFFRFTNQHLIFNLEPLRARKRRKRKSVRGKWEISHQYPGQARLRLLRRRTCHQRQHRPCQQRHHPYCHPSLQNLSRPQFSQKVNWSYLLFLRYQFSWQARPHPDGHTETQSHL